MNDLIEKLKLIAESAKYSDSLVIQQAIDYIKETEAKLVAYEDDATDWQVEVQRQMTRRINKKTGINRS